MADEFDAVVAGGGVAGLTAGLTLARAGRRTLVLTGDILGGQLVSIDKIEGFPGFPDGVPGYDLCPMLQEQAMNAGAEFATTQLDSFTTSGPWRLATGEGEKVARAVVLASGTSLKELGAPGEGRLRGRGVSHCASCDAPLMRGKKVAVVGGGDSAMQEALTLAEAVGHVVMLVRGQALAGQGAYRDRVTGHNKIEIRFGVVVEEVLGESALTALRVRDKSGVQELEVSGLFAYIGLQPNTAFLDGRVELDSSGGIVTDAAMRTNLPGIAAAGSVRAGSAGRAAASAGEGAAAAIAVDRYLSDGVWRE